MPTVSIAASCSDSNWNGALRAHNLAVDEYQQATDYLNKAANTCDDHPDDYRHTYIGYVKILFAKLNVHLTQIDRAAEHYQEAERLYDKAADKWYSQYQSCDYNNSDKAYESYRDAQTWGASADERLGIVKTCSSQIGRMKEIMLAVDPDLDD